MTDLGKYLLSNSVNKADVYYKTGIDESRLSVLSNDSNTLLYADEFYLIANAINADLGLMLESIFHDKSKSTQTKEISKNLTVLGKYISAFLNTKKDLAKKAKIQQSRLSKLINDHNKRPYAIEIYSIAISTNNEPQELFELLYGHLELNSIEKQKELKEKSKQTRSSRNG